MDLLKTHGYDQYVAGKTNSILIIFTNSLIGPTAYRTLVIMAEAFRECMPGRQVFHYDQMDKYSLLARGAHARAVIEKFQNPGYWGMLTNLAPNQKPGVDESWVDNLYQLMAGYDIVSYLPYWSPVKMKETLDQNGYHHDE